MDTLLQLYDSYQRRCDSVHTPPRKSPASCSNPRALPSKVSEDEDVLVKLVRVLANMCIHPAVGPALATNATCVQLLMETLGEQSVSLEQSHLLSGKKKKKQPEGLADFCLQHFLPTIYLCHTKEAVCENLES